MDTSPPETMESLRPVGEIIALPERIETTISLDEHIWKRRGKGEEREFELATVRNFVITSELRAYLTEIFRKSTSPYDPQDFEHPIGQGWWVQADFGSGKSHLLAYLTIMATAGEEAWEILTEKERRAGKGKRESLAQFKEGMLRKRIFPLVKNLVGGGGQRVGTPEAGKPLIDYIVETAQETFEDLTGQKLRVFPDELVVSHFMEHHFGLFKGEFKRFLASLLGDGGLDAFLGMVEEGDWRDAGGIVWQFYERNKLKPDVPVDAYRVLKHLVRTILQSGFDGVLVILDEVSEFLRRSPTKQADEDVLLTLAWPMVRRENLPIWTVCAAQQRIEERVGSRKIVSPERFKLLSLLQRDEIYYDIVLNRTRSLPPSRWDDVDAYQQYYKDRFRWVKETSLSEFRRFFPFHPEGLANTRHIVHRLTTARSGIAVLYDALKKSLSGRELVTLDKIFDELESIEEGDNALATAYSAEYESFRVALRMMNASPRLSHPRVSEKLQHMLKILFLYHLSGIKESLSAEEIADLVMMPRSKETTIEQNLQHFQLLLRAMCSELTQIRTSDDCQTFHFTPSRALESPQEIFNRLVEELRDDEAEKERAYEELLKLDGLEVKTSFGSRHFAGDQRSDFCDFAPSGGKSIRVNWQGREIFGRLEMSDLSQSIDLPELDTPATGHDFLFIISSKHSQGGIDSFLMRGPDPRCIFWEPQPSDWAFQDKLLEFAAFRAMIFTYNDQHNEEAERMLNWVTENLPLHLAELKGRMMALYRGGRVASLKNSQHDFSYVGNLETVVEKVVGEVLDGVYRSRQLSFRLPQSRSFTNEEGIRVINGLVRLGRIPEGARNTNTRAAESFAPGLKLVTPEDKFTLNLVDSPYPPEILEFIRVRAGQELMPMDTLYRNFTGLDWGLSKRMVEIYTLALVRNASLRVTLRRGALEGAEEIDYANIAQIEFNARILDALDQVGLVAFDDAWERIRSFVAVMIGEEIPETKDQRVISAHQEKLEGIFASQREAAPAREANLADLFAALSRPNPFAEELGRWSQLFGLEVRGDSARKNRLLRNALERVFGYDLGKEDISGEVAQFEGKWERYAKLSHFLDRRYDEMFRHLLAYQEVKIPPTDATKALWGQRKKANQFLGSLPTLILDPLRLGTEFKEAYERLAEEYFRVYNLLHYRVYEESAHAERELRGLLLSGEMQALSLLDEVTALGGPLAMRIGEYFRQTIAQLPRCEIPSPEVLQAALSGRASCKECGLTIANAEGEMKRIGQASRRGREILRVALLTKVAALRSQPVLDRIRAEHAGHPEEKLIRILELKDVQELASYLAESLDEGLVELLRLALREILIVPLSWEDFKPSSPTIQQDEAQIKSFLAEVHNYLEEQFAANSREGTLVVLQWQGR